MRQEDRRKSYTLTEKGSQVLAEQIRRVGIMAGNGKTVLPKLKKRKTS